jgi:hypothetical protein
VNAFSIPESIILENFFVACGWVLNKIKFEDKKNITRID